MNLCASRRPVLATYVDTMRRPAGRPGSARSTRRVSSGWQQDFEPGGGCRVVADECAEAVAINDSSEDEGMSADGSQPSSSRASPRKRPSSGPPLAKRPSQVMVCWGVEMFLFFLLQLGRCTSLVSLWALSSLRRAEVGGNSSLSHWHTFRTLAIVKIWAASAPASAAGCCA